LRGASQGALPHSEPEAAACAEAIEAAPHRRISAANFVKAAIVIDGSRDPVANRRFDNLVKEAQLVIEAVTEVQARITRARHIAILAAAATTRPG
jgi:ribonuclease VapC